ncbi:MAG: helix-turn-helix transcriptional regulator [Candidatus Eremiobacteraeota bacterium]|nr:helix-turn-helix transcriptional regulator [Candidatus Eremiobacteraeota bacterium]
MVRGPPPTRLAQAIRRCREGRPQRDVAPDIGINRSTLARIERGTHQPSAATALKLAPWLGWTVEQVLRAAQEPAREGTNSDSSRISG